MSISNAFCNHLVDGWRSRIFREKIYPGFPFSKRSWRAIVYNRDNVGDVRIPERSWGLFINGISKETRDRFGFVASPYPLMRGLVADIEQPFQVELTVDGILNHFTETKYYLPEFYMVGSSESWALWGDSDFTVLGGDLPLISSLIESLGGEGVVLQDMLSDFSIKSDSVNSQMYIYIKNLLAGGES